MPKLCLKNSLCQRLQSKLSICWLPEWIPPDLDRASDLVKLLSPRIEFYARPRSAFN
jgi:hypothetical protein